MEDKRNWKLDTDEEYTVRGTCHMLVVVVPSDISSIYDIVWTKTCPLKVSLFA